MTLTPKRWLVFARKKAEEPLAAIGDFTSEQAAGTNAGSVTSEESVASEATARYGNEWLEMIAIPETAASWAIQEE